MLNNENTKTPIAVRLFDNNKYGTTHGKGLYRKAIYNGTVEATADKTKYLVDFYSYEDWRNMAKTDEQMEIVANVEIENGSLYSWVKHYDSLTQAKTTVPGMCSINMDDLHIDVFILDTERGVETAQKLNAKPCRQGSAGSKSPQLLATNADLSSW